MGLMFSKKQNIHDVLFSLEEKILKEKKNLKSLEKKNKRIKINIFLINIFIIIVTLFNNYIIEEHPNKLQILLVSLILFIIMYGISFICDYTVSRRKKKLYKLLNLQELNIEKLKGDKNFLETKNIFDRYQSKNKKDSDGTNSSKNNDVDENREDEGGSLISGKAIFEKVTDIVLGDDKEDKYALICMHCHTHNGLKHPDDSYNVKFICYSCKVLNDKNKKDQ